VQKKGNRQTKGHGMCKKKVTDVKKTIDTLTRGKNAPKQILQNK
jgi:hypothetical protein